MTKKVLEFLKSEGFLVIFFSLILLLCSYGPLVWQFLSPPPGKAFLGTWGYPNDFLGNLMVFQEGRLGHWQIIPKYSSTLQFPPTAFFKIEYLLLGQLSRLFPLPPIIFFHLARFFLSATIIMVGYVLIGQIFKSKSQRLLAFLMAFFSTTLDPRTNSLTDLWSPLSVFTRVAYYPHYLFSFLFILLSLLFLGRALKEKKMVTLLWASFWGFLAAQVHPPTIISLYLTFPFYLFFVFLRQAKANLKDKLLWRKTGFLSLFTLVTSLPLFYLYQVTRSSPWDTIYKVGLMFNLKDYLTVPEFLLGIGPLALLSLIGAVLAVKAGQDWLMFLAPWSFVYILGFYFVGEIIGYNGVRFLQTPFFIVLGILSVPTLDALANWLKKKKWLRKKALFQYLLVLILLAPNLPAYRLELKLGLLNFSHLHDYVYSPKEVIMALNWLSQNTQEENIVLSVPNYGNIIAGLAGNWPFVTTFVWTLDPDYQLENTAKAFLSQGWPEETARQFVKNQKIKYIFFGPEEKTLHPQQSLTYPFLEKAFENSEVIIYKVVN